MNLGGHWGWDVVNGVEISQGGSGSGRAVRGLLAERKGRGGGSQDW